MSLGARAPQFDGSPSCGSVERRAAQDVQWTAQQVVEACPFDLPGRFLVRDNDSIYSAEFVRRVDSLGLEQVRTAPRSPWQNCFAERWISSLRRGCLDHVIALNERQLSRVVRAATSSTTTATGPHLGLEKDAPVVRAEEGPQSRVNRPGVPWSGWASMGADHSQRRCPAG